MIKYKKTLFLCVFLISLLVFEIYIYTPLNKPNSQFVITDEYKTFELDVRGIPQVKSYLALDQAPDSLEYVLSRMQLKHLLEVDGVNYYILSFGGAIKLTNQLLIKESNNDITYTFLDDFSIFQEAKVSVDKTMIAFLLGRPRETIMTNKIIVVDTASLKHLTLQSDDSKYNLTDFFNIHIDDFNWLNNDTLSLKIPLIDQLNEDSLRKWFASENRLSQHISAKIKFAREMIK